IQRLTELRTHTPEQRASEIEQRGSCVPSPKHGCLVSWQPVQITPPSIRQGEERGMGPHGGRESRPFEDNASQIDCGTAIVHSYITAELKLGMNPSPSLSLCVCVYANLKNASKPTFDLIFGGSNTVVISLIKTL
ncbi:Inactive phospholipase C-like protein 1, partial [Dissostichus eleginoides]